MAWTNFNTYFFYMGFSSLTWMIHRTEGEGKMAIHITHYHFYPFKSIYIFNCSLCLRWLPRIIVCNYESVYLWDLSLNWFFLECKLRVSVDFKVWFCQFQTYKQWIWTSMNLVFQTQRLNQWDRDQPLEPLEA